MMKCRVCGTKITSASIKDGTHIKITYNDKNYYFCCKEHCGQYMKEVKIKEKFYKDRDEIDKYVKANIMLYKPEQVLPKYFFDRLSDLANGTVRCKEGSKVVIKNMCKEGYPLEVILQTFKSQRDTILYWFRNKSFSNESQKLNYMWRIIEGKINDEYDKWLRLKNIDAVQKAQTSNVDQSQLEFMFNKEVTAPKNDNTLDMTDIFEELNKDKEVKDVWET